MYRVVTDLGILGFDETGRMRVEALHPGVTPEQAQENTGFELLIDSSRFDHGAAHVGGVGRASPSGPGEDLHRMNTWSRHEC